MTARLTAWLRHALWRRRILRLGIVDLEYVQTLTGRVFRSARQAVNYYLRNEGEQALGLSLSPLVEADWIVWSLNENRDSWYANLFRQSRLFATSPYFDAARYAQRGGRRGATGRALRHFLRHATGETLMPVADEYHGAPLTWAECRARALADAATFERQLRSRRQRTSLTWDAEAEARLIAELEQHVTADDDSPVVSILLPTRDRAHSVLAAIRSVQAQTYQHWQLIVVDDGSIDDSVALIREATEGDERVTVLATEPRGVSAARNHALAHASGAYLAFIDSDNEWRPRFLELNLAGLRAYATRAVHCAAELHRDRGRRGYRGMDATLTELESGNFIDLNSLVVERQLVADLGGFDESIRRWVDYDLLLRMSPVVVPRYVGFIGVDYDNRSTDDRISSVESLAWEDVVLGRHLVRWGELERALGSRDSGLVSVVMPTLADWRLTRAAVDSVLAHSGGQRLEVIVIDNASSRHIYAILRALYAGCADVRIERMPRNLNFALANNVGLALSTGAYFVALNNDTEVTEGWLEPLVRSLDDGAVLGAQPLLLYPDGSIQTAGTVFPDGGLPQHFLTGEPRSAVAAREHSFSAVTAAALCMRAADLIALQGFDPLFTNGLEDVDLCLRASRLRPGRFEVVHGSVVYHHEGSTLGRSKAKDRNRALFLERWGGTLPRLS